MDNPPAEPASNSNSLGLDLEALKIKDHPEPSGSPIQDAKDERATPAEDASPAASAQDSADAPAEDGAEQDKAPTSPVSEGKRTEPKEKKKPYVNPERVRTGGAQRDKLSEEELAERMVRIREQNEKIKQRRMDVKADEDAFKKMQEAERIKVAKIKKVQENIDRTREQNARRKMEKIQTREWDSGKSTRDWKQPKKASEEAGDAADSSNKSPRASVGIRGAVRGGGAGRGRGRITSNTENRELKAKESKDNKESKEGKESKETSETASEEAASSQPPAATVASS